MNYTQSGATQWRYDCDCAEAVAEERHTQQWQRMHSQVSKANAKYFIEEDRLATDMTQYELRDMVDTASGTIIVCNVCGKIKEAGSDTDDSSKEQSQRGLSSL